MVDGRRSRSARTSRSPRPGRPQDAGLRAHPVQARRPERARAPAADRPADDQQVLRRRPRARELDDRVPRRPGPAGVRDLVAQPRRARTPSGASTPTCRPCSTRSRRPRRSAAPTRSGDGPVRGRHRAGGRARGISPPRARATASPGLHASRSCVLDTDRAGMTGALVDDTVAAAAVADSAQRGYLDGKRARGRVRLAAAQRPDLELLGQQLPAGQGAAGLRHPLLERRHHADARSAAPRLHRGVAGQPAHRARAS